MTLDIFDKPEHGDAYKAWVDRRSNGYVINHYKNGALNLHCSFCSSLKQGLKEDTHPTTKHKKICADHESELRNWAVRAGFALCEDCRCLPH